MRCLIIAFLLSVSLAAAKFTAYDVFPSPGRQPRIFEDQAKDILKCVRNIAQHGAPDFGILPFDPLKYDNETFDLGKYDPNIVKGSLQLKAFTIKDLSNWNVTTIKINPFLQPAEIKFELINRKVTANGDYNFDSWFLDDHSFGYGTFKSSFADLLLKGCVKVSVKLGKNSMDISDMEITDFDVNIISLTVGKTNVEITGLMDDKKYSKYVSDYIEKYINNLLQEYKEDFNLAIKNGIKKVLQSLGITKINGLIDLIKHICKDTDNEGN